MKKRTVTMLEVINRIPSRLNDILANKESNINVFIEKNITKLKLINEIIIVASGSSLTSSQTAMRSMEQHTQKKVTCVSSNEFLNDWFIYPDNSLYLFISQSGTSGTTRQCQEKMAKINHLCCAITESNDTLLARESTNHIIIGSGTEEYGQRTIGYTTTVFTLTLLGIEIGRALDNISDESYIELYNCADRAINNHTNVVTEMMEWFEYRKRNMMRARAIVFIGSSELKALATEGSVKIWETPQVPSFGYELEESMHSINYGMDKSICIVVFEGLGNSRQMTSNLVNWLRDTYGNVYYLASDANGENPLDFKINNTDNVFRYIEFSAAMQVMNYRLAVDQGRDLRIYDTHEVMNRYFKMHQEE